MTRAPLSRATAVRRASIALAIVAGLGACAGNASTGALAGGDPAQGKAAIRKYGCGTCHTISGVRAANGLVGPPLAGIGNRVYVAGVLPNTPDNLIRWIRFPQHVDPLTAMPELGVTEADARNIASYLYTLK